ncbi:MAG: YybS family protein [Treponema sp.]|nr:YybS family protein [Treponema sp.]
MIFQRPASLDVLDILLKTGAFSLLPIFFAWIIAPPAVGPAFLRMRTLYRFVISSLLLLSIHIPMVYNLFQQEGFYQSFLADVESVLSLTSLTSFASGSDVVEQSLLKEYLTADNIVSNIIFFGLRGGGLLSIMLFFFMNRQLSFAITKLFRKTRSLPSLLHFKIKSPFIWVLSFSILAILISLQFKLDIIQIIAWNIFVLCVIMYAAQGLGIVLFFLNKPNIPRGLRILFNLFFILMIFRFSVMIFFIAAVMILGILENWVPLRAPKTNKPPSTPEV